jgi:hypothetical protein
MDCHDCQHQPKCLWLLSFLHRWNLRPCGQGRYIKGRGLRQATLTEAAEVPA